MTAIDDFFIRISVVLVLTAGCPFTGISQDGYPQKSLSRETATLDIRIDLNRTYQTISNFGASDAWSCQFVGNWPQPAKDSIADWLFSQDTTADGSPKGIGLSLWRFNIGAGSARQREASGIKDEWRRTETWQRQQGQQWFLQAAKQRGVAQFLGFFNSPPVQLTTNTRAYATNGRSNIDSAHYDAFARYSVDVLKGIKQTTGITLDYISPVNEPQWDWSDGGQEGCPYTNKEISGVIKAFSAALLKNRITTRLLIPESGENNYLWEDGNKPGRGNQITAFFNPSSPSYIRDLPNVSQTVASHSYFTTSPFSRAIEIRKRIAHDIAAAGGLDYWQSEYCILGDNAGEINGGTRDLGMNAALYMAGVIYADLVHGNAAAWQWWLAISPYNYKDGLIYIDKSLTGGSYHDSKMLWALGNYSRFIRPGMKRVYTSAPTLATGSTPPPSADSLLISAWKDEEKKKLVVVVVNRSSQWQPIKISGFAGNTGWLTYTTSRTQNLEKKPLSSGQANIPPQALVTLETTLAQPHTSTPIRGPHTKTSTPIRGPHTFALSDSAFLLDGKPFQMISAEMHYPRIPREAWRQRMKMARAMGINTIGTYVFWNLHEPRKGEYDFSGNNDIAAFVRIAQEEGLWVVLRPSPYVCAEWEFGGYPYWLQKEKGLVVRSNEPQYLQAYNNYIRQVGRQLSPLLVTHGGNIVMVQVENEYGSYADDTAYLDTNRKIFIDAGFDGILYTCDAAKDVAKGHLPGLFPAVNGLITPETMKSIVRKNNNGKGPFYMAEWYPAWFDWWGEQHHTVPAAKYVDQLDKMLGAGISVNMYMFHGGTTRGFMNGANCYDTSWYQPQISSYDYDAPLDEAGNATDKFMQFRNVIARHLPEGQTLPEVPGAKKTITIPAIPLQQVTSIFNTLPVPVRSATPLTFEDLDQGYGYVLYRTTLTGNKSGLLKIKELRDYGIVFVNGKRQGVLDRMLKTDSLYIEIPPGPATIDILVENMGRINFGPNLLKNKKGITEKVALNGLELKEWQLFSLPFDNIGSIRFDNNNNPPYDAHPETPVIRKGVFDLRETGDTYLDMRNWGKGCVWINGHHLGRYWEIGPQQTLYVPVEWLKKGSNEIVILELIKPGQNELHSIEKPILSMLRPTP